MKHFNLWALALLFSIGMSSCALSYQYCDAYNGVDFDASETETVEAARAE